MSGQLNKVSPRDIPPESKKSSDGTICPIERVPPNDTSPSTYYYWRTEKHLFRKARVTSLLGHRNEKALSDYVYRFPYANLFKWNSTSHRFTLASSKFTKLELRFIESRVYLDVDAHSTENRATKASEGECKIADEMYLKNSKGVQFVDLPKTRRNH